MPHKRAKRSIRTAEQAKKGHNLPPKTITSSYAYDDTPRLGARILNSHKVQQAFHASGRSTSEDTGERRKSSIKSSIPPNPNQNKKPNIPKIMPNESLGEYNRRVEAFLRPGVSQAIKDAAGIKAAQERALREEKRIRKLENKEAKLRKQGTLAITSAEGGGEKSNITKKRTRSVDDDNEGVEGKSQKPIREFAPIPPPRRLNDIVQAPPQLPHLRRSKTQTLEDSSKSAFRATGRNPLSLGQQRLMEVERERVVRRYREMKALRAEERGKEKDAIGRVRKVGKGRTAEEEDGGGE